MSAFSVCLCTEKNIWYKSDVCFELHVIKYATLYPTEQPSSFLSYLVSFLSFHFSVKDSWDVKGYNKTKGEAGLGV